MTEPFAMPPDVDALLMDILRSELPEYDTHIVEAMPADWTVRFPLIRAHCWSRSAGPEGPGLIERTVCDVDVFSDDRTITLEVAQRCRMALYAAWASHALYPHGSLCDYSEQMGPTVTTSGTAPDQVTQVHATYVLHVWPPNDYAT